MSQAAGRRGSEGRNTERAQEPEAVPEGGSPGVPKACRQVPGQRPRLREEGKGKALPALTAPRARPERLLSASFTEVTGAAQRPHTAGGAGSYR